MVATLLAIQLGWGLWLMPYDYARLGWAGGTGAILLLGGARPSKGLCGLRIASAGSPTITPDIRGRPGNLV